MRVWPAALVACAAALSGATAVAATYTCVGADGKKLFSDRPCPQGSNETARGAQRAPPATAESRDGLARHGLTFGLQPADTAADGGPMVASCHAKPAPTDRARGGTCDPYNGDTACSRALPLLCFRPADAASTYTGVDPKTGRYVPPPGPAARSVAMIGHGPTVRGDSLVSEREASQVCAKTLGAGWRMASFHDGGGWQISAQRHQSVAASALRGGASRYWVFISDQAANCWNADAAPAASSLPQARPPPDLSTQREAALRDFKQSAEYQRLSVRCRGLFDQMPHDPQGADRTAAQLDAWFQSCGAELAGQSTAPPSR